MATDNANTNLKPYQKEDGSDLYKYLLGHPRQYRFDGKAGVFNINGSDVIGKSLTFQPIAWRIFTDNILGMGTKNWAEIFFVDTKNCVSAVLFHGYSVDNLFKLIEPLYYDDKTLADVVITATAEKKQNKDGGTYYMAYFTYAVGNADTTATLKAFANDHQIYRAETLTDMANIKTAHNFYNPFALGEGAAIAIAPANVDPDSGEIIQ